MTTPMTVEAVVHEVVAALAHGYDQPIKDTDRLREDLHLASMAQLELAVTLEDRLKRPVADAVVLRSRTVGDLITALRKS